MLEAFLTFINQQKIDLDRKSTLLTVSGGVDSIVLVDLFYRAGFKAGIAHCNFGLRNEESDGDEAFVTALADTYGFPLHLKRFQTREYAKNKGVSTQMAARDLRYRWFGEIRKEFGYDYVATAHHINDSLETVLLNFTRGTGLAGLHGIAAKNDTLIRPLLFASRNTIENYIHDNQLSWREDSSNESDNYRRNLIRHKVVPVLKSVNPAIEDTFNTFTKRISAAENLLNGFLDVWKTSTFQDDGDNCRVVIRSLMMSSEPVYRLWYLLKDYGFGYLQAEEIFRAADKISGKVFYSATHQVLKDRDYFIISPKQGGEKVSVLEIVKVPGTYPVGTTMLTFDISSHALDLKMEADKSFAYLNADKIEFPLRIRPWMDGDTFCPFGMGGKKKKVSDLLIDLKLNKNQKNQTNVLLNGNGDITWVIGLRADERYRVVQKSKNILMVQARNLED